MAVAVYKINPLQDQRWAEFLLRHDRASLFHTPQWLEALRRTYGYSPIAYSTSPPCRDLLNGLVFCQVQSRLTGRRLVSLPFSDHCEPLLNTDEDLQDLSDYLVRERDKERWGYIEVRPIATTWGRQERFQTDQQFYLHTIDLSGGHLFHKLHKNSTQRKIQRAQREGLKCEYGRSDALIQTFYSLLLTTRKRHGLPPPPLAWFYNLRDCLRDQMIVRLASKGDKAIASILTIRYKNSLTYKYACSDSRYHNLGGVHLLLWRAIEESARDGLVTVDLGRSDSDNIGLITFKNRWGASCRPMTYLRYPSARRHVSSGVLRASIVKWIVGRTPRTMLGRAGQILYRHMG